MKIRIISAIVALAIFIPLIVIGGMPFTIAASILSILAYKEVLDLEKSHHKIPNIVKVLGLFSVIYLVLGNYGANFLNYRLILVPIILLLLPTVFYKNDNYNTSDAFYMLGISYLIGMLFNLTIVVRSINVNILVYLLSISIMTDTFAYAIGCLIGKHKMSKISPNKSWEGFAAGLIGGTVIPLIVYVNLVSTFSAKILFITLALSIIGQIGDLFYSKIKRENNIKDFSNIMPGHGGVLDRLDSLSFIVITYIILLWTI